MWKFWENILAAQVNAELSEEYQNLYNRVSAELIQANGRLKWYQRAWDSDAKTIADLKARLGEVPIGEDLEQVVNKEIKESLK